MDEGESSKDRQNGQRRVVVGVLTVLTVIATALSGCQDTDGIGTTDANGGDKSSTSGGMNPGSDGGAAGGEKATGGSRQGVGGVAGAGDTFGIAGERIGSGGASGQSSGGAGSGGQAGVGGASSDVGCVEHPLLGTYQLQAHNKRTTICSDSSSPCLEDLVQDHLTSFSLYQMPEQPDVVFGDFDAPGIELPLPNSGWPAGEHWDNAFFYYPKPGETVADAPDINAFSYQTFSAFWDPTLSSTWVRVSFDACFNDGGFEPGYVRFDIDLKTGKILQFIRSCADYLDSWTSFYSLTGTGELACDLNACNDLIPATSPAAMTEAAGEKLTGGMLSAGTYRLSSIVYSSSKDCTLSAAPRYDTLVVSPSSDTGGTIHVASDREPDGLMHSTMAYSLTGVGTGAPGIRFARICGPETFDAVDLAYPRAYAATPRQLKVAMGSDRGCLFFPGGATYVYDKL